MITVINERELRDVLAPLYRKYPRQTNCQGAYVQINPATRSMSASWDAEVGNAMPMDVWLGLQLRVGLSPYVDGAALADYLAGDAAQNILNRICAGWEKYWDGNNYRGRLTEDATEAVDDLLDGLADLPQAEVVDAGDYLYQCGTRRGEVANIRAMLADGLTEVDIIDRYALSVPDNVLVDGLNEEIGKLIIEAQNGGEN